MSTSLRRTLVTTALAFSALAPLPLAAQARLDRRDTRGQIAIRWLGHAAFEVTSPGGTTLLLDPFISGNPSTPDSLKNLARYRPAAILVTHSHDDHALDAKTIAQRSGAKVISTYEWVNSLKLPAAQALGGTLNTAFMTVAAEASSRYHIALDAPVDVLRSSMAISTRNESSGANAFSLVRMLIPTGEMPITDRFEAISEASANARSGSGGATLETLASVAAALPTSLVTRIARTQAQTVEFATSNVRASPIPMYLAGAQILENYPIGPLAGVDVDVLDIAQCGSRFRVGQHQLTVALGDVAGQRVAAAYRIEAHRHDAGQPGRNQDRREERGVLRQHANVRWPRRVEPRT